MPGQPITLGPFTDGFTNRIDNPALLSNASLLAAENFLFDVQGNLVTRPPIIENNVDLGSSELEVLLWTYIPSGVASPEVYDVLVVTNQQGTWISTAGAAFVKVSDYYHAACVQGARGTDSVIWFGASPNQTGTGGYWALGDTSITTLSNIPQCRSMALYKERVWMSSIVGGSVGTTGSLVAFSALAPVDNADFDQSDAGGFVLVNPNDGETVNSIITYRDTILVFKDASVYIITYDTTIDRMQVKPISDTVGAFNDNVVRIYNDVVYVLHERYIYRFTGQSFSPISERVIARGTDAGSLSVFNDTLIARRGTTYYVYNFYTDSWTTWATTRGFNWLVERPAASNTNELFYVGGRTGQNDLVNIQSTYSGARTESFTATVQTKYFTLDTYDFKRMFGWGAGIKGKYSITGAVDAVGEFQELAQAWDHVSAPDLVQPSPFGYYYKFMKAVRFKQISFRIVLAADGTEPATVHNIVAIARTAQRPVGASVSDA